MQHRALRLFGTLAPLQPPAVAASALLPLLPQYVTHALPAARRLLLRLAGDAWAAAGSGGEGWGNTAEGVRAWLAGALLALLGDGDAGVRGAALQWWHAALPRALGPRLQALLQHVASSARLAAAAAGGDAGGGSSHLAAALPKGCSLGDMAAAAAAWRTAAERRWGQAAAQLLLLLPGEAPGFEAALFDTSLAHCEFQDYR